MQKILAKIQRHRLMSRIGGMFFAFIALIMLYTSSAIAAGYTCNTKVYVSCNGGNNVVGAGYYLSNCDGLTWTGQQIAEPSSVNSCKSCPTGYFCDGGRYCPKPAEIECAEGQYIKANAITCSTCEKGHRCPGGTLTPGTSNVGIYKCAAGTYAAAGSASCSSCQGRTKYSGDGAEKCSDVGSGYYTTDCDNSGNKCEGRSQCTDATFCTDGIQYNCPSQTDGWTRGTGTGWTQASQCNQTKNATAVSSYCKSGQLKQLGASSTEWATATAENFTAKAGSYVSGSGASTTCKQCEKNTYQATDGSNVTSCTACDDGYHTDSKGATSCTANTYTVRYFGNGATDGTMADSTHTYDKDKVLTTNGFTEGVKKFLGWSTSAIATTVDYTNGQTVKNLTTQNGDTVNLWAVWGGECQCSKGPGINTCNATAPLGVCGVATATAKTGYKNPTCGAVVNDTSSCSATPITFSVKYTKSPDAATGTVPTEPTSCTYDDECPVATNPFSYTGYVFTNWSCAASSGSCKSSTYTSGGDMKNATSVDGATLTLTPSWTEGKWNVSYGCGQVNSNLVATGKPAITTATEVKYNQSHTTSKLGTCALTGYTASNWKVSNSNDTHAFNTAFTWKYTENKTFTPTWTENSYTVKYSCGTGTGTPPSGATIKYSASFTAAAGTNCTRAGFKFTNWGYDKWTYNAGESYSKLTATNGDTVTLTAQYEPDLVGCKAGNIFNHATVACEPCLPGYYCEAWCLNSEDNGNCKYDRTDIYSTIGGTKYSNNFKSCLALTTSDAGAATKYDCYASGNTPFTATGASNIKITGIKSFIYQKK